MIARSPEKGPLAISGDRGRIANRDNLSARHGDHFVQAGPARGIARVVRAIDGEVVVAGRGRINVRPIVHRPAQALYAGKRVAEQFFEKRL